MDGQRSPLGLALLYAALLALAWGCSDSNTSPADSGPAADTGPVADAAGDAAPAWTQPFDPAVCQASAYSWLPPSTMGKVVSQQRSQLYSLPKAALEAMVKLSDYKGAVTIKYGAVVYFFRYETQDRGRKVEATAALGFPDVPAGQTLEAPQVLWLHGTSGFSDNCAPTRKGADAALPVALMASQGYIGVAPDFLGMNGFGAASTMPHPYLVGEATALASLDSLRAAQLLVKQHGLRITPRRKMVAWGGSQGGHATLFTLLYAPYYYAGMELVGGVALIPPVDLLEQTRAGLAAYSDATAGVAALSVSLAQWYGHQKKITEALTDAAPYNFATALPKLMKTECGLDKKKYPITKVDELFTADYIAAATKNVWKGKEHWRCMLSENSVNRTSVKRKATAPVLMVVSEQDELVNPVVQRKSFDALCAAGNSVQYLECKGASHTQGAVWSLPEQFSWVQDRLAGKPLASKCKRGAATCCAGSDKAPCKKP